MIRKLSMSVVALLVAAIVWLHMQDYSPLVRAAVARVVTNANSNIAVDPNKAEILFCGTGSPNRTPFRASPCLAIIAYGDMYLFDAGEGAIAKLQEFNAPVLRLRKVFLTHLHSDHMSGVAEVFHNTWLYGREEAIDLVGPVGTRKLMDGIRMAYEDDIDERMFVLGPDGVRPELAFTDATDVHVDKDEIVVVHEDDKIKIEAFQVDHPHWSHAYGYRITVAGKTIVVSGDTIPSDGIRRYGAGADFLIHEAFNSELMRIAGETLEQIEVPISAGRISRIGDAHTDTLDLADLSQQAQVKHLVLTHVIPALPDILPARRAFMSGMDERYDGPITMAHDGMRIVLD